MKPQRLDLGPLGIEMDNCLNFELSISTICKRPAGQLNALSCLKSFINHDQINIIGGRFVYSNFNYCLLIWHFGSRRSMTKIEDIQKRTLQFVLNDYASDYETLSNKSNKWTMEVRRLSVLSLEVFLSVNKLNSDYMHSLFEKNLN